MEKGKAVLQRRWSGKANEPSETEMRAALTELETHDPEHPDCWLSDQAGWTISAFESRIVVFENVESGEGPWHMPAKSTDEIVELWKLLQAGDIPAIKNMPWADGYGPK